MNTENINQKTTREHDLHQETISRFRNIKGTYTIDTACQWLEIPLEKELSFVESKEPRNNIIIQNYLITKQMIKSLAEMGLISNDESMEWLQKTNSAMYILVMNSISREINYRFSNSHHEFKNLLEVFNGTVFGLPENYCTYLERTPPGAVITLITSIGLSEEQIGFLIQNIPGFRNNAEIGANHFANYLSYQLKKVVSVQPPVLSLIKSFDPFKVTDGDLTKGLSDLEYCLRFPKKCEDNKRDKKALDELLEHAELILQGAENALYYNKALYDIYSKRSAQLTTLKKDMNLIKSYLSWYKFTDKYQALTSLISTIEADLIKLEKIEEQWNNYSQNNYYMTILRINEMVKESKAKLTPKEVITGPESLTPELAIGV